MTWTPQRDIFSADLMTRTPLDYLTTSTAISIYSFQIFDCNKCIPTYRTWTLRKDRPWMRSLAGNYSNNFSDPADNFSIIIGLFWFVLLCPSGGVSWDGAQAWFSVLPAFFSWYHGTTPQWEGTHIWRDRIEGLVVWWLGGQEKQRSCACTTSDCLDGNVLFFLMTVFQATWPTYFHIGVLFLLSTTFASTWSPTSSPLRRDIS